MDYLTMTMVELDGDAIFGLDAQAPISSQSSPSSLSPTLQTDLLIYYGLNVSPLNEPVFGIGGDELLPDIDDFLFLPLNPDPWHGLKLADNDFTLDFDLESHERLWEEVMAPAADSLACQETYSPFNYGSPSPLSITHHLPIRAAIADINIRKPTTPSDSFWSQESPSPSSTFLSPPSPKSRINSGSSTPCSPSMPLILCSWDECGKTFFTDSTFNHHLKYHTKPFHCPHCPLQQATKRLLHRHINERHFNTEKYYCTVDRCNRSMDGDLGNGGRHFTREDNCRRHLRKIHGISGTGERRGVEIDRQVYEGGESEVVDMDELTRRIRRQRKFGRRKTT